MTNKMNLSMLGVQEMTVAEMRQVDGGFLPLIALGVVLLFGGCATSRYVVATPEVEGIGVGGTPSDTTKTK